MYSTLEHLLDYLIDGLWNGFILWMTIAFIHHIYTHLTTKTTISQTTSPLTISSSPATTEIPKEFSICTGSAIAPNPSEIPLPLTFCLMTVLQKHTKCQLQHLAKELGLVGYSRLTKDALVTLNMIEIVCRDRSDQCYSD